MTSQAPLALEYHAHGQAAGWRKNEHLINALPYIDALPAAVKAKVDMLIEEEKRRSKKTPADYLRELPPVPATRFEGHPALQAEYERVRSKLPMPALDTARYRLDPPPQTKRNDFGAWKSALDNANSQLEHQHLRIMNQELLLKNGDKVWRAQTQLDESILKWAEAELAETKKEIEVVNKERKLQQTAAGAELSKLEQQYVKQALKNFEIERACDKLEEEVNSMEDALQAHIRKDTANTADKDTANTADKDTAHTADSASSDQTMTDQAPQENGASHG